MKNLNLIFNKIYYSEINTVNFDDLDSEIPGRKEKAVEDLSSAINRHNLEICSVSFDHEKDYKKIRKNLEEIAPQSFLMETMYPGFIIGSGNPHCAQLCSNDINNGFSFDYVTGQPYIPGSSVKGVLRSCFRDFPDAVDEILKNIFPERTLSTDELEKEIFDGNDIFFDAVIYDGDKQGKILGTDYITPHPSETKEPRPILILKLLPEVCLKFFFRLNDGLLTAEEKTELFITILSVFGAGAKTNTGYGRLVHIKERIITDKSAADKDTIVCEDCGKLYRLNDYEKDKIKNEGWRINRCRECRDKRKQQKNGGNYYGKQNRR